MRTKKFVYRDMGIKPKNCNEVNLSSDMLNILQIQYKDSHTQDPEYRKRVCEIFGFVVKMAMKYLPPKQRKIFYSVWLRSGGKKEEGIMEFSRKTGEKYVSNYGNYYKAINNLRNVMVKIGYDKLLNGYLKEIPEDHGN